MLTKTIKYVDFNGTEREETFNFNLSKAEVLELELGTNGGMTELIKSLLDKNNGAELMKLFKKLILTSYGIKSIDGKRFQKSEEISTEFEQTGAYEALFMELVTDQNAAAAFMKGLMPEVPATDDHKKPDLKLVTAE